MLRILSLIEIVRYAGLSFALLSSVLTLFVFKRTLSDESTAFLLSAFGTSGFAVFACLGFGKPIFQRLAKSRDVWKEDQFASVLMLWSCAVLGSVSFPLLWSISKITPYGLSGSGVSCWIGAYALTAAIQPLRDVAYISELGPAFEIGEFVRRIGALVSIGLVLVDKSCLSSGVVYLMVCIFTCGTLYFSLTRDVNRYTYSESLKKILLITSSHWKEAFKFLAFTGCELAFYLGPYILISAIGTSENLIIFAYFQRLFQGITTFTRVPADVGIYELLKVEGAELRTEADRLTLKSISIALIILALLAIFWDTACELLMRENISRGLYVSIFAWVVANCFINVYGNYVILSGDNYYRMAKVSLAMLIYLVVILTVGNAVFNGIIVSLVLSSVGYAAMAGVLRMLFYRLTHKKIDG